MATRHLTGVEQTKVKWYRFGTAIVRNGKQASSPAKTQQGEQAKQRIAVPIDNSKLHVWNYYYVNSSS
jgi:hypothetical protein